MIYDGSLVNLGPMRHIFNRKCAIFLVSVFHFWLSIGLKIKNCLVSQYSSDGFGHQVEGKLSCLIADYLSKRLSYIHIPFYQMQHTPQLVAQAESFVNLGFGSLNESYVVSLKKSLRVSVNTSWVQLAANGHVKCKTDAVYVVDNCWDFVYKKPVVEMLQEITPILRKRYFATPKVDTGFNTSRYNIVVHIRRGDARIRIMPIE